MHNFKVYITGGTEGLTKTMKNICRLNELIKEKSGGEYTLKIIDILENPKLGQVDHVIITPTLIKIYPLPVRRVIGSLSDIERVLTILSPELMAEKADLANINSRQ